MWIWIYRSHPTNSANHQQGPHWQPRRWTFREDPCRWRWGGISYQKNLICQRWKEINFSSIRHQASHDYCWRQSFRTLSSNQRLELNQWQRRWWRHCNPLQVWKRRLLHLCEGIYQKEGSWLRKIEIIVEISRRLGIISTGRKFTIQLFICPNGQQQRRSSKLTGEEH